MNKNVIMGIIAVAALGAALFLMLGKGPANNEDAAEGMGQQMYWQCNACKQDVIMTKQEWADRAAAGTMACPSCQSQDLLNAVPCPLCNRAVPTIGHGRLPTTCPHCNGTLGDHRDVSDEASRSNEAAGRGTPPPG